MGLHPDKLGSLPGVSMTIAYAARLLFQAGARSREVLALPYVPAAGDLTDAQLASVDLMPAPLESHWALAVALASVQRPWEVVPQWPQERDLPLVPAHPLRDVLAPTGCERRVYDDVRGPQRIENRGYQDALSRGGSLCERAAQRRRPPRRRAATAPHRAASLA